MDQANIGIIIIILIIMVKSFAIDARFERPQTCLFKLVILQYRMLGYYIYIYIYIYISIGYIYLIFNIILL